MKKLISSSVIVFAVALLAPQILQAQGTITYLSNMIEPSIGNFPVGSNSWLAVPFITGNNPGGYILNSIQIEMADASGSPSDFTAMLYLPPNGNPQGAPGNFLTTLTGSADPATNGIYTYAAPANFVLAGEYFLVVAGGTAITDGAYEWSKTSQSSYNLTGLGNWQIGVVAGPGSYVTTSMNGSTWSSAPNTYLQFAINATAVPEPSSEILLGLGGVFFGLVRWKAKSIP
jgi:hypothetical protein